MLTKEERNCLIDFFWLPKPLRLNNSLTPTEQELVRKCFIVIGNNMPWRSTHSITDMYVSVSPIGKLYLLEYHLVDLALYALDMHHFFYLDRFLGTLPLKRLPELLVCDNADLRYRVNARIINR